MDGELGTWLEERLRLGDVPRIVDIVRYAKENKIKVTRKAVVAPRLYV